MTFWVSASVAVVLFWASGFWAGRWHARYRLENARGGYITIPAAERVENWCCPDRVYDQEARPGIGEPYDVKTGPKASLSHPLIPDMRGYDDRAEFTPRVDPIAHLTNVTLDMTHKALGS